MKLSVKAALIIAVSMAIFTLNGAIFWSDDFRFLMTSAIFGALVGIIALPEFDKRCRKGAGVRNLLAGILSGAGIAVLQEMSLEWAAVTVLAGGALGYLGLRWVRHLQLP
ncbi:hypothetical protein [Denitrobaculum tricleocarpae]|uniref:Uncharacterized protein n=1 Tax=Denitrobaculum tricleocarpae TaxID=2591009 RepID=A0A545TUC8_9PROT|nr:hypothetical protein [Denitrobaculum tricleocarpae]TQV80819.1 hypothetical protein FKG95_11765 [Denitrobaculum tricleocarpae]